MLELVLYWTESHPQGAYHRNRPRMDPRFERINANAQQMVDEGRQIFRFDTFGDAAFWGDTLKLHQAIQGSRFGGVGPGVSRRLLWQSGFATRGAGKERSGRISEVALEERDQIGTEDP